MTDTTTVEISRVSHEKLQMLALKERRTQREIVDESINLTFKKSKKISPAVKADFVATPKGRAEHSHP